MGITNFLLYSLIIYSNRRLIGCSLNLRHLTKLINNFEEVHLLELRGDIWQNGSFLDQWLNYLTSANYKGVLLISNNFNNTIEVLKDNGYSDLWQFEGVKTESKYSYFLTKQPKQIKSRRNGAIVIDYDTYLFKAISYLTALNDLMIDESDRKLQSYFENALRILTKREIDATVIPVHCLPLEAQLLIRMYELTGGFINFRDWNPFLLGEEREKQLCVIYEEFMEFRSTMFVEIMNSTYKNN
jgi:hypothetical protein